MVHVLKEREREISMWRLSEKGYPWGTYDKRDINADTYCKRDSHWTTMMKEISMGHLLEERHL